MKKNKMLIFTLVLFVSVFSFNQSIILAKDSQQIIEEDLSEVIEEDVERLSETNIDEDIIDQSEYDEKDDSLKTDNIDLWSSLNDDQFRESKNENDEPSEMQIDLTQRNYNSTNIDEVNESEKNEDEHIDFIENNFEEELTEEDNIVKSGINGTTSWTIDKVGKLIIKPIPGTEGLLQTPIGITSDFVVDKHLIKSIVVEDNVKFPRFSSYVFANLDNVTAIHFKNVDTSSVIQMPGFFKNMKSLETVNVEQLDVIKNQNFNYMFENVSNLKELNVSEWNVSNATAMHSMFAGMSSIKQLDVTNWNVSNVNNMTSLFENMTALESLDVSKWDVSSVAKMTRMFSSAKSLTTLDLNNWNVSSVNTMSHMFSGMQNLSDLHVSNWNTLKLENAFAMFDRADSIKSLDLSNWMTNNVTDFGRMFANTTSLEHLNISNWDVSKASSTQFMFMNATAITELNINAWKLDSVNSTHKMFSNASSITHLDLSNWELSKANDVSNMFEKMTSLQSLDLRSWNLVDSRANTYYVFKETPVKKLILGDKTIFNKDPELPDPTNNNQYTGRWIKEGTHTPIYNDSNEFLTEYDGVQSGTYIWQQKYEIEFVIGDKVFHENIASYVAGVGAPKLLPAFKKGSHFIGWFDLNGNIVTSISPLSTGKIVLTARFMDEMYEINYDLSGGINDDRNPSSFSFGLGVDRLYPATKEGYTFIGWFDEHDQLVSHISKDVSSNVNLFAKFVANEYGVVYELDGGVNHIQNPKTFIYGVGVEKLYPASKIGHTFIGWFDEMGTRIHNISLTVHKDITLFARFEVNEYEIIYNLEGGFNDSRNPHTYLFGEGVKKLFSPIRESYVFKGWYDENDKKVDKIDGDEQKVIILTARWEKEIKDGVSSNTPPTGINNETTLLISIVIIATLYLTYSFKIKNNNKDKSSH